MNDLYTACIACRFCLFLASRPGPFRVEGVDGTRSTPLKISSNSRPVCTDAGHHGGGGG